MARSANFEAIGTQWEIRIKDDIAGEEWGKLMERVYLRIQAFDKAYSRFRTDSLVMAMSQEAGRYELPPDAHRMLEFYEKLNKLTDGKVTPLIGQVMEDAGYDATYSLNGKKLQHPPAWDDVIVYEEKTLTMNRPAMLDFGAAGKGYLVDIIGELIEQAGVRTYVINAGGDLRHRNAKDERLQVGMENPTNTREAIGIVELKNKSLCASAGSKRTWGSYHHIIDPTKLTSPQSVIATWVIADDTMTADGLATALYFTDAQTLARQFTFSYALLSPDMGLVKAKGFPAKLFQSDRHE
jgi:thiamine biosynthesis lipoprotein